MQEVDINPRWLSISSACKYASLSYKTLMRYILAGDIYGTKKGGKWIVDRLSIDRWMLSDEDQDNNIVARLMKRVV